jgi:L-ascorbate metabolism protein UlaG (beta-lactamase superfamily)
MKTTSLLASILITLPLLLAVGSPSSLMAADETEASAKGAAEEAVGDPVITVHYTGNEGFLLEVDGKKILVDALYREGVEGYVAPPAAQSEQMETGKAPFDGIDLALASHYHADHFHPDAVGTFLSNHPDAIFISTVQSRQALQKAYTGYNGIEGQVRGVKPEEGTTHEMKVDGMKVEILNLHHGRTRPVENVGFLLEVGGRRIFHMGDTEATTTDLEPLNLSKKPIDLAFVPFWYLVEGSWRETISLAVSPRRIVVMHMPGPDSDDDYIKSLGGWEKVVANIKRAYPHATIFREPMESAQF